jgi:hypothetical protein
MEADQTTENVNVLLYYIVNKTYISAHFYVAAVDEF